MTRLSIRVANKARQQIRRAGDWWIANRSAAPGALADEIERAFEILAVQPGLGAPVESVKLPDVRRFYLSKTRHYLYYRADKAAEVLVILALWHTSRGSEPRL